MNMGNLAKERNHAPLSPREEFLGREIVDAAYKVHTTLGPGLLEQIYELCFCHELEKRGIPYKKQVYLPIQYDGLEFKEGLRLDVLVDNLVICELKAVENLHPVYGSQLLSYLRLANKRLGYLINFNVSQIKYGIKRVIL